MVAEVGVEPDQLQIMSLPCPPEHLSAILFQKLIFPNG